MLASLRIRPEGMRCTHKPPKVKTSSILSSIQLSSMSTSSGLCCCTGRETLSWAVMLQTRWESIKTVLTKGSRVGLYFQVFSLQSPPSSTCSRSCSFCSIFLRISTFWLWTMLFSSWEKWKDVKRGKENTKMLTYSLPRVSTNPFNLVQKFPQSISYNDCTHLPLYLNITATILLKNDSPDTVTASLVPKCRCFLQSEC